MQNLELKAISNCHQACVVALEKMPANFKTSLYQIDTYFHCATGRLKLRQMMDHTELIGYNRPDSQTSRYSQYQILSVSDPDPLKQILTRTLGVKVVVEKQRSVWLFGATRIHLDRVENLGQFIELETVIQSQSIEEAEREHQHVKRCLKIEDRDLVGQSYSDLLHI